ncbi:ABC transporter permease [Caballeronia sp. SEWSISQ10-4 2]|uniref:ABC transporter permease n=1 Tax=Caballeronia sp. SEWSISQ10-4 2 TaxID=2937438 RepID=UPI00264A6A44|nr:ABC transporter permease [Caballeronia sp. SEWSISQ10-4 2]MDN7182568.1 ABC transporter permease [Caballeronia sp. SEWSISQ10-4 2]
MSQVQTKQSSGNVLALTRSFKVPQWWLQSGALLAIFVVLAVFSASSPLFFTVGNLANVMQQSAVIGTLAFGLTLVLIGGGANGIAGGIDLSIAANLGFCAAVYATALANGLGSPTAIALTLSAGTTVGVFNAFAIVVLRMLPLLATLTTMNIVAGLELVVTRNSTVSATGPTLAALLDNGPFAIPWLSYAFAGVGLMFVWLGHFTRFGLRLHASGSHPAAVRAAGLRAEGYVAASYVLCGLSAGIAALASTALLSGSAPGAGENLLAVIAAALLGVVFSRRLVPTVAGTWLSVVFLGLVANGFQLDNVSSYWISGVEGALILFVVSLTALLRRRNLEKSSHA